MNMNRSVQTRWEQESRAATQQRTEYDFDKEKWMKQMRIDTMDCIVDPTITPIRYTSWKGIKRGIDRFITMRKLKDRRPDFDPKILEELFKKLKTTSHALNLDDAKQLQLMTTHLEADRICKEIRTRMNDNFTNLSWKALRQRKNSPRIKGSNLSGASSSSLGLTSASSGDSFSTSPYRIEVLSFDLVNSFMGQMSKEDWVQLTYRCEFKEKSVDPLLPTSQASSTFPPSTSSTLLPSKPEGSDISESTDSMKNIDKVTDKDDWVKQLEYPVFEVPLTDGFQNLNRHSFKVVGVLKKDGTRYGKDAQDASELRRQFQRAKKWF